MEYFIYNNTNYTVSITDVHYVSNYEAGNGGSLGMTAVFRVEPKSWNTTRRCDSQEVEKSLQVGMLRTSRDKGNIIVCDRSEYEEKTREQATGRMESALGLSGQEKEVQQGFGFLNKVAKQTTQSQLNLDINDFLVADTAEEIVNEPEQEVVTHDDSRISALEEQVSSMQGALKDIVGLLKVKSAPKKSIKKNVKKVAPKKKNNVQNRKRK